METPLIHLRKSEIVRLGVELGAPFHVSWSCYSGEKGACGTCESCVLRLRAFREIGISGSDTLCRAQKRHLTHSRTAAQF